MDANIHIRDGALIIRDTDIGENVVTLREPIL